jgi:hypothetical protein
VCLRPRPPLAGPGPGPSSFDPSNARRYLKWCHAAPTSRRHRPDPVERSVAARVIEAAGGRCEAVRAAYVCGLKFAQPRAMPVVCAVVEHGTTGTASLLKQARPRLPQHPLAPQIRRNTARAPVSLPEASGFDSTHLEECSPRYYGPISGYRAGKLVGGQAPCSRSLSSSLSSCHAVAIASRLLLRMRRRRSALEKRRTLPTVGNCRAGVGQCRG